MHDSSKEFSVKSCIVNEKPVSNSSQFYHFFVRWCYNKQGWWPWPGHNVRKIPTKAGYVAYHTSYQIKKIGFFSTRFARFS